jgi:hypothetical protein
MSVLHSFTPRRVVFAGIVLGASLLTAAIPAMIVQVLVAR